MIMITIYHNPRCSKSRATLALLEKHGANVRIVEYLKKPPTSKELSAILSMLSITARSLLRTKESVYKSEGLDDKALSEQDLISAIIKNPILMERPIVVANNKAIIGRPPENVLTII
ncbi:MAG: arsenate reductase (glutaredoxin) [Pseudomonadota bacterium]|nr:arsenate reductase (glutaredoxin) [Pseudomonadota bacterium]